jgi:hypothetical protein
MADEQKCTLDPVMVMPKSASALAMEGLAEALKNPSLSYSSRYDILEAMKTISDNERKGGGCRAPVMPELIEGGVAAIGFAVYGVAWCAKKVVHWWNNRKG